MRCGLQSNKDAFKNARDNGGIDNVTFEAVSIDILEFPLGYADKILDSKRTGGCSHVFDRKAHEGNRVVYKV